MSVIQAIMAAESALDASASLAATTSTAEISLGPYAVVNISASGPINIKFGKTGMTAAAATNFQVPANTIVTYQVSKSEPFIRIFNPGGGSINYWIQFLSPQV